MKDKTLGFHVVEVKTKKNENRKKFGFKRERLLRGAYFTQKRKQKNFNSGKSGEGKRGHKAKFF